MENKIKVTVEYESQATSKIDALMEQYALASQVANQKTSEIMGVIKEVGRAKFLAIGEQLKEIGSKLRQFCLAGNKIRNARIYAYYKDYTRFEIRYNYEYDSLYYGYNADGMHDGASFFCDAEYPYLIKENGLVTKWNEYDIINTLNKALEEKIISETKDQFANIRIAERHLDTMLK